MERIGITVAMDPILSGAITAIRNGDKAAGRHQLSEYLQFHPSSETAWLWMAATMDDGAQRQRCIKKVLSLNPNNLSSQRELQQLTSDTLHPQSETPQMKGMVEQPLAPNASQSSNSPVPPTGQLVQPSSPYQTHSVSPQPISQPFGADRLDIPGQSTVQVARPRPSGRVGTSCPLYPPNVDAHLLSL